MHTFDVSPKPDPQISLSVYQRINEIKVCATYVQQC